MGVSLRISLCNLYAKGARGDMKKLILVGVLMVTFCGMAEASMLSDAVSSAWSYLTAPINCLSKLGVSLVAVGADFVQCVLNNVNPGNIIP